MFRGTRVELLSVVMLPLGIGLAVQGPPDTAASETALPVPVAGPVSFAEQIVPIFEERCAECHSGDNKELELGLVTYEDVMKGSEYGTVIEAGDPDGSLLIDMIAAGEMPEDGDPLTEEQIELIRSWIAAGAENN